jgi:hypothetical protein
LVEALFACLQAYEDTLDEQLFPFVEDVVGQENMSSQPTMILCAIKIYLSTRQQSSFAQPLPTS